MNTFTNIIGHKCVEGDVIYINKVCLCNISKVLDDMIIIDDECNSVIDEIEPTLSKVCVVAFKYLCEMNSHFSNCQEMNKNFSLSKTLKDALPAIEKWDCPGLLRMMFDDINNTVIDLTRGIKYCHNEPDDIIKYEELVLDDEIMWNDNVFLFILFNIRFGRNKEKLNNLKKNTLYRLVFYMNCRVELDVNKLEEVIKDDSKLWGIDSFVKYS